MGEMLVRWYLHCDGVAAESVEDVGGAGEVGHQLCRGRVRDVLHLQQQTAFPKPPLLTGTQWTTLERRPLYAASSWLPPEVVAAGSVFRGHGRGWCVSRRERQRRETPRGGGWVRRRHHDDGDDALCFEGGGGVLRMMTDLAVDESGDGEVPRGVGGHAETEE